MKRNSLALLMALFTSTAFGETSYTYLVYVGSFPAKVQFDALATNGKISSPVPVLKTRTLLCPNTNYAFNEVAYDPGSGLETTYNNFVVSGWAKLIKKQSYYGFADQLRGGNKIVIDSEDIGKLPDDMNIPWVTVKVST